MNKKSLIALILVFVLVFVLLLSCGPSTVTTNYGMVATTGGVTIFDVATGNVLSTVGTGGVAPPYDVDIVLTPDGSTGLVAVTGGVIIFDVATGSVLSTVGTGGVAPPYGVDVVVTPDGSTGLVAVTGGVIIFDIATGNTIATVGTGGTAPPDDVDIVLTPSGSTGLVAVTGGVIIFDVATGNVNATVGTGAPPYGVDIVVTPDGSKGLVAVTGGVIIFDIATGNTIATVGTGGTAPNYDVDIVLTPDGSKGLVAVTGGVIIFDVVTGTVIATVGTGGTAPPCGVDIRLTPDGSTGMVAVTGGVIIFDVATGNVLSTVGTGGVAPPCGVDIVLTPSGTTGMVAVTGGVIIFDVATGNTIATVGTGGTAPPRGVDVVVTPNGLTGLVAVTGGVIIFDVATGNTIATVGTGGTAPPYGLDIVLTQEAANAPDPDEDIISGSGYNGNGNGDGNGDGNGGNITPCPCFFSAEVVPPAIQLTPYNTQATFNIVLKPQSTCTPTEWEMKGMLPPMGWGPWVSSNPPSGASGAGMPPPITITWDNPCQNPGGITRTEEIKIKLRGPCNTDSVSIWVSFVCGPFGDFTCDVSPEVILNPAVELHPEGVHELEPGELFTPIVGVVNRGAEAATDVQVTCQISSGEGELISTEMVELSLQSAEAVDVVFSEVELDEGSYHIAFCTDLPCDENLENNCIESFFDIYYRPLTKEPTYDAAAQLPVDWIGEFEPGLPFTPVVEVSNLGQEMASFPVFCRIYSDPSENELIYNEQVYVPELQPGESTAVIFPTWIQEDGSYCINFCTNLDGDEDRTNDCVRMEFDVGAV